MPSLPAFRHQGFTLVFSIAVGIALLLVAPPLPAATAAHRRSHAPKWTRAIDRLLDQPDQQRGFWGVYIYSLDRHRVLYDRDGERLFTPASNTKLFTTAAALALLGPGYRFHTAVQTTTPPDAMGVVHGDLVLVGDGDPTLSGRQYPYRYQGPNDLPPYPPDQAIQELADQIARRGVKVVDGAIVGDDSYFANEHYAEGWSQDDLVWGYGAAVSALTINDNERFVEVWPGPAVGQPAMVRLAPDDGSLIIENRVRTTAASSPRDIELYRDFGSRRLIVWGTMPAGSAMDLETAAVQHPARWAARLLKRALRQRGIEVLGDVEAHHLTPAWLAAPEQKPQPVAAAPRLAEQSARLSPAREAQPQRPTDRGPHKLRLWGGGAASESGAVAPHPASFTLASLQSPPLWQALQVIDKVSQNLHAELMLRLIGKIKNGDGSLAGGLAARSVFLTQAGLTAHDYYFRDGSGLSRENLVKPQAITNLLIYMDSQPYAALWRSFLPIAGQDGSLERRFGHTLVQGRIFAKTGYVEHVHTLSGYATTLGGEHLAFSIMVNNDDMPGRQVTQVIDAICEAMIQPGHSRR